MDIDDMIDILAIELLGVIPDDQSIVISTNRGEPAVTDENSLPVVLLKILQKEF